ncbi:MAG: NAD-binding protein [Candidatus Marinimicrobia bacterium]|nr:NAD-binding protein [Candidatus Neomarinimicrobiota bacterium]
MNGPLFLPYYTKAKRIFRFLAGYILGLSLLGALGYMAAEGVTFREGVYRTLNVISTLGSMQPDHTPAGRVVTMLLIVLGAGGVALLIGAVASAIVTVEIQAVLGRRNMYETIKKMHGHLLICGFGRMGRQICEDLERLAVPFVVIDQNAEMTVLAEKAGYPNVQGNAHDEEVLEQAGIKQARGVVTVLASDADNVFVVLTARELNPKLHIVARAENDDSTARIRRAGADQVISPVTAGARLISTLVTNPAMAQFFSDATRGENLEMVELLLPPGSPLIGQALGATNLRQKAGALVVSIRDAEDRQVVAPSAAYLLRAGDRLLCIGAHGVRAELAAACGGAAILAGRDLSL